MTTELPANTDSALNTSEAQSFPAFHRLSTFVTDVRKTHPSLANKTSFEICFGGAKWMLRCLAALIYSFRQDHDQDSKTIYLISLQLSAIQALSFVLLAVPFARPTMQAIQERIDNVIPPSFSDVWWLVLYWDAVVRKGVCAPTQASRAPIARE
jgi:hypothetical protein